MAKVLRSDKNPCTRLVRNPKKATVPPIIDRDDIGKTHKHAAGACDGSQ
jgi:hypothetical protein